MIDLDLLVVDSPALTVRNPVERAFKYGWRLRGESPKERKALKHRAAKAARRAARQACSGVRPRMKKRPGDSWEVV